jgi:predicted RNA-binding protein with RPS1 domain
MNKTEMRLHEPGCRRENLLAPGTIHKALVSAQEVDVKILERDEEGFVCLNLATGRKIRIRSTRRFRSWMDRANVSFKRAVGA